MTIGHTIFGSGKQGVIVLHGWFGDYSVFEPMLPYLDTETFTYAFVDFRGYGQSRNQAGAHTMAEISADAVALADHLGWKRFHVVGHSMGGTTARYVAGVRPDLVASVTSIGSPHFGSKVADVIQASPLEGPAVAIGNAIGGLIALFSGDPSQQINFLTALESLNTAGSAAYNAAYPAGVRTGSCRSTPKRNTGPWWWPNWVSDYSVHDGAHQVNGVRYYSWSGVYNPLFNSSPFDPIDGIMAGTSLLHGGAENDGLVDRCSTHLGDVIRDDYTQNHLDEVNLLFGLRGLWTSAPLPLYTAHARRLKDAGL